MAFSVHLQNDFTQDEVDEITFKSQDELDEYETMLQDRIDRLTDTQLRFGLRDDRIAVAECRLDAFRNYRKSLQQPVA